MCFPYGCELPVPWLPRGLPLSAAIFYSLIGLMVYSNQYQLDPMTATRPLEDDQPLGAVPSHRVIFKEVPSCIARLQQVRQSDLVVTLTRVRQAVSPLASFASWSSFLNVASEYQNIAITPA
jgi:hypothetical protein